MSCYRVFRSSDTATRSSRHGRRHKRARAGGRRAVLRRDPLDTRIAGRRRGRADSSSRGPARERAALHGSRTARDQGRVDVLAKPKRSPRSPWIQVDPLRSTATSHARSSAEQVNNVAERALEAHHGVAAEQLWRSSASMMSADARRRRRTRQGVANAESEVGRWRRPPRSTSARRFTARDSGVW